MPLQGNLIAILGWDTGVEQLELRHPPYLTPHPTPTATLLAAPDNQYLEQSPQATALFYWEQRKERMKMVWPTGPPWGLHGCGWAGGIKNTAMAKSSVSTPFLGQGFPSEGIWLQSVSGFLAVGAPLSEGSGPNQWSQVEGRVCFGVFCFHLARQSCEGPRVVELITANYLAYNTQVPACWKPLRGGRNSRANSQVKASSH